MPPNADTATKELDSMPIKAHNSVTEHSEINVKSDEYVSILEKLMDAMALKLRELASTQNVKSGNEASVEVDKAKRPSIEEPQKIEITRVSADQWRKVKTQAKVDTKLSVLIVSSKQNIKIRRVGHKEPNSLDEDISAVGIPYRLAINSTYLLHVLGQCTGTTFLEERNVLVRPFKYLVAYEVEIKDYLKDVEAIYKQAETRLTHASQESINNDLGVVSSVELLSGDVKDTSASMTGSNEEEGSQNLQADLAQAKRNRDEVRCLVDFMDQDMRDIFEVNRAAQNHSMTEIAFENLWMIYKPGSIIYSSNQRETQTLCRAYRVIHVTGGRVCFDDGGKAGFNLVDDRTWDVSSENDKKCKDAVEASVREITTFIIDCYCLDFDGYRIGPIAQRFAISPYTGHRSILSFPVYPSLFNPMHDHLERQLIQRGRRFMELVSGVHKKYSGLTFKEHNHVSGKGRWGGNWNIPEAEIKGEIMVDQASGVEHFKKKLFIEQWNIKFDGLILHQPTRADKREVFDPLSKQHDTWTTDVMDDSGFEEDRRSAFVHSTDERWPSASDVSRLTDNVVRLLPPRVFGYSTLHHKWFPLNVNIVEDFKEEELKSTRSAFENLVLPDGHRTLLQALIKNQIRAPEQDIGKSKIEGDDFSMDLVKGKGNGLIILLHGVPGVGKTSTAESVAAHLRRPLLPITCGDIGDTAKAAEESLEYFCDLAHKWRCVLLLDEADVFLAKREKSELARNSLVSVFLRVLEYYSGVIILTTNRVGEFDEAFRSRIHISLYYPNLNRESTNEIWERNISRIKTSELDIDIEENKIRRFYERHWQENKRHPSRRWNGRQIKNAFQTALALAKWEFHDSLKATALERPFLQASHFEQVAETSAHFDDYISDVHGMQEQDTYGLLAARDYIRKDTHPGTSPRTRMQEGDKRRSTPARRTGSYRHDKDDFDDQSYDDDVEHRKRGSQAPSPGYRSRRAADSQELNSQYFHEDDIEGQNRFRTGRRTRFSADETPGTRDKIARQDIEGSDVDVDYLDEMEQMELKLARMKKRRAGSGRDI